jgi:hypothetical protein
MMDTIAIRLPTEQILDLKETARKQGQTVSHLVRKALAKAQPKKKTSTLAADLLKIAEKGRGIKTPVTSENYKEYLYGKYWIE